MNPARGRMRVSAVMPVYNEMWTVREIFRRVTSAKAVDELVIIDDGSTDGSYEILQELVANHRGRVAARLFRQPENQGKGAAIRRGFAEAQGDIFIIQDADLEYDPSDYPKLVAPIVDGVADVVYGSRFLGWPRRVLRFWHHMINKTLTTFSNMTTNLNLTDMATCYKVFKAEIARCLPIRCNRFAFDAELTAKVAKLGCRVYEVPVAYHGRSIYEGKKIGLIDAFQHAWAILKYWMIDDLLSSDIETYSLRVMQRATVYNRWLFEKFRPHVRGRVLEIGSGIGNITRFLVHCPEVVATDVDPRYLRELETVFGRYANVHVQKMDVERPPRSLGTFDTIVALNVLEHIEDEGRAFENLHRRLRPGGRLIALVPAHPFLFCDLDRNLGHHRRYTREALEERLQACGFKILEERRLNKLGAMGWFVNGKVFRRQRLPSVQMRFFSKLVPFLDAIDFLPPRFGISILAIAER